MRGALYNNLIISEVVLKRTKLSEQHTPLSVRKKLIERIKNSHLNFQTLRTNATLTSYEKTLSTPSSIPKNSTVKAYGFDVTDNILGKFLYGKVGIVHLNLV